MNKQNAVQWILGALLTITLTVGGAVWNNYRDKINTRDEKIEVLTARNADLRLANTKYELELKAAERECAEKSERIKDLERQARWRSRKTD